MDVVYEWPSAVTVRARSRVMTWAESIADAGGLLVQQGACTPGYVTAMRDNLKKLGPYVVVAPGVALPHARPEDGVLRAGLAVLTLAEPIEFGHATNDPVDLVIAFTAHDNHAHIETLRLLSMALQDTSWRSAVRAAATDEALLQAIGTA